MLFRFTPNTAPSGSVLKQPFEIGEEVSITGKWVLKSRAGMFGKAPGSQELMSV